MAEVSAISWTDATLPWVWISPKLGSMGKDVTAFAKRHSISEFKSKVRVFRKRTDVVSVDIAAPIISAMAAGKFVSKKNVIPPTLQLGGQPQSAALNPFPVDIARRVLSSRGTLAGYSADLGSRLWRMLFADTIARTSFCRCAHLRAAFGGHF